MIFKESRIETGKVNPKTIIVIVLVSLFTLFLLQNAAVVDIQFLFWRVSMSRVILLFGSLVVGGIIGLLIGWEIFGKHKK